jgi:SpoIID/LytB domain protein
MLGSDGRYSVISMPIEVYVARVLAGEAMRSSAPAALEALAIAIRTFAVGNMGRHRADGFDVCNQTHCQVVRAATPATEHAAESTAGALLLKDGSVASIYYTASCGGRTEKPSAVWPGAEDPSFLPVKNDDACQGAPVWSAELSETDLLRAFRSAGFRGSRLLDMRVTERTSSGRVASLKLQGLQPAAISGQDLRVAVGRAIGWQHLKSTAFDLRRRGDMYRFDGHGSGHGVGLCVIGSARLAEQGRSVAEILARYFPGLDVSRRPPTLTAAVQRPAVPAAAPAPRSTPSTIAVPAERTASSVRVGEPAAGTVAVSLFDNDESLRRAMERQAQTARSEIAKALGVTAPPIALRVHPTTEAFEGATGMPWFTFSTVVNHEVQLAPVGMLRDRGVLDQAVRRAIVHAIVDEPLKERPAWVRDGAALFFADPRRPSTNVKAACPSDIELTHPVSIGALSTAYTRARACFARQVAAGRSWRDVH